VYSPLIKGKSFKRKEEYSLGGKGINSKKRGQFYLQKKGQMS